MKRGGFTLIELLIGAGIIAFMVLVALSIFSDSGLQTVVSGKFTGPNLPISITDGLGNPTTISSATASSSTDPAGTITVVIPADLLGQGTLTATDTTTTRSETLTFTVIP